MPAEGKICTFDCIYCECGFNHDHLPHGHRPTREEVKEKLEKKLQEMHNKNQLPDVITFAGNGEPTTHPNFDTIVDDTIALRNNYCPKAKISVLTNSTLILHPKIREALRRVDNNILKLDTIDPEYIQRVDRPIGHFNIQDIIEGIRWFGKDAIIQTMFMKGEHEGKSVDNTTEKYVAPWLKIIEDLQPREVMVYTLDRETPAHHLRKASHEELDKIAERVRKLGIPCQVSY